MRAPALSPRSILAFATALVLGASTLGCGAACPPQPACAAPVAAAGVATAPAKPSEPHHVYKLDFVLTPGGTYSLTVEETKNGEIRVGSNVPLQPSGSGASPRQDVGLSLHASFTTSGDELLLHTNLEMSFVDEAQTPGPVAIHKLVTAGDVIVAPGKSVVVNSMEDPATHKRFQLLVTATKMR